MFELPEYATLAAQLGKNITGRTVRAGTLGNSPHKFVWYNRTPEEFASLIRGKRAGRARAKGRWLLVPMEPGYELAFGECGGKILFHSSASSIPKKYHLSLVFDDGTAFSATTQMWGAMELFEKGQERKRKYIVDMRITPADPAFTVNYFSSLVDECVKAEKRSVKGLLTQDQLIPGLGNAIAQDIMFKAGLHPKHPIDELGAAQKRRLHAAIVKTVGEAIKLGGRADECDLYGNHGGYVRIMDKNSEGAPCPQCGRKIQKMQYLGGACYFCPRCQT
jgi:formamidopyrimidine-DNA glycosylase